MCKCIFSGKMGLVDFIYIIKGFFWSFLYLTRLFRYFLALRRALKSFDQRILCSSKLLIDKFEYSKIVNCSVGLGLDLALLNICIFKERREWEGNFNICIFKERRELEGNMNDRVCLFCISSWMPFFIFKSKFLGFVRVFCSLIEIQCQSSKK